MKTVFYNGKVYTGELPLVSAFAVEGEGNPEIVVISGFFDVSCR